MLFTLVITHLFALAASNPFHKYPYVFLLDVGNEELQNTDSEQIRVSIPGGSLALRYPAISDGDPIAHIRVSGIDFGTDLKVNIVDGGPGSKYVVLVFMGNPGVAYDAVVTIQTVADEKTVVNEQGSDVPNDIDDISNEVSEEENNSAEESDGSENVPNNDSSHSELTQESSHSYKYANNAIIASDDDENDVANENNDNDYNNDKLQDQNDKISNQDVDVSDYDENNDDSDAQSNDQEDNDEENKYNVNNGYVANEYYNKEETAGVVDNLYYDRLNFIRPYLYNGGRFYQYQPVQYNSDNVKARYEGDMGGQVYENDIHSVAKDTNNNDYDSDDNSAVES